MNAFRPNNLLAAGLVAVIAGTALPALDAQGQRGRRGDDRQRDRHVDHDRTRGSITINRVCEEFWFSGTPTHALAAYLADCGYEAWIEDGCVRVAYQGRRPRISLHVPGYSFSIRFSRGCIVIRPVCLTPPPRVVHAPRVVIEHRTARDHCPPPRWQRYQRPRWGWNFKPRPYRHTPGRCW